MSVAEDFQVFLGKLEALKRIGELTPESAQKLLAQSNELEDRNPELPAPTPTEISDTKPAPETPHSK
jgi:hypothetical protein